MLFAVADGELRQRERIHLLLERMVGGKYRPFPADGSSTGGNVWCASPCLTCFRLRYTLSKLQWNRRGSAGRLQWQVLPCRGRGWRVLWRRILACIRQWYQSRQRLPPLAKASPPPTARKMNRVPCWWSVEKDWTLRRSRDCPGEWMRRVGGVWQDVVARMRTSAVISSVRKRGGTRRGGGTCLIFTTSLLVDFKVKCLTTY